MRCHNPKKATYMPTARKTSNLIFTGAFFLIVDIHICQIFCPVILYFTKLLHCEHQNPEGKPEISKSSNEKKLLGFFRKIAKSDYYLRHVCLSVCPYKTTRPHLTAFHEISYVNMCQKSITKIQVLLNPDKNNRYFTRRPIYVHL
jgi:hypothetical protein